tara:strand:+ start:443 stop:703 length:261 start_codon:yes stop_codon:yes gene_type:complete
MTRIIEAILDINPNAKVSVHENDVNKIEWHEETTPISKSEIESRVIAMDEKIKQDEIDTENKKASGKQKLKDLGLDDDEIKALMGA